jgi:2-oxoglutarate ferredoxin oxidoreductase subunit alpha
LQEVVSNKLPKKNSIMPDQLTLKEAVILFAGDSGDGIQLTGNQFTETVEITGHDISTFPNYPADIRAPQGTLTGVSGFQLKFGSQKVFTPGDSCDVLVAMNAAALKVNIRNLKPGGIIIANESGFDSKNLRLAGYEENPLIDDSLDGYTLHKVDITRLTNEALKDSGLGKKEIERSKNMFALGFLYWMFSHPLDHTKDFITKKFTMFPELAKANILALETGYHWGDNSETFTSQFKIEPASLPKGKYRNLSGNQAVALGLAAAGLRNDLPVFYGSYPITPASEVLQELAKMKAWGIKTFQAEDEIAAIGSAIGAAFGGSISSCATSGPGMALKSEALGLAMMEELPLVIVNVQRGGPSTGLPTKTEQSDLLQALYGRNGEAPIPVLSISSPGDAFETVYEASRIAVEHMTPVIVLSDGYIANGAEPWRIIPPDELKKFNIPKVSDTEADTFLPYQRDEKLVRKWAIPGQAGFEHRIGGLEKHPETGAVSYDPDDHEKMVKERAEKVARIADDWGDEKFINGSIHDELLVLGWGSTYGAIETAVTELRSEGEPVAHIHLRNLFPFRNNLGDLLSAFDKIIIPELNGGQLAKVIRDQFLINPISYSKVQGLPLTVDEIKSVIKNTLHHAYAY